MKAITTIQVEKKTLQKLQKIKEYPRQSYNELLDHVVAVFSEVKKRNSYDEFLHKIQQNKMKELWDNKADEDWEHA